MTWLHLHRDTIGDELIVSRLANHLGLVFRATAANVTSSVYADRDQVRALARALGQWLTETEPEPETGATAADLPEVVRDAIREEVRAEVARHLAGSVPHQRATGPDDAGEDPEPRDVGHPTELSGGLTCRLCGGVWNDGHGQPGDPCGAPCRECGRRSGHKLDCTRGRSGPKCAECGHPGGHHHGRGYWYGYCTVLGCACSGYTVSAPGTP